jgi:hypothetical protein
MKNKTNRPAFNTEPVKEGEKQFTRVVFKMTPKGVHTDRECIAFLLDAEANAGNLMSYMHVGQHSEASIEFCVACHLATPEEYADLKTELESIGYDLKVCKRR